MAEERDNDLHDWLEAEAVGDDDRADEAFAAVFSSHVTTLAPSIPVWQSARVRAAVLVRRRWRWLPAAAAMLLVSLGGLAGAAFASAWVFDLFGAAVSGGPRVAAIGLSVSRQVSDLVRHAWLPVEAVGRALALAAATGPAAAVIAANLTIAFAAAFALSRLLTPREE